MPQATGAELEARFFVLRTPLLPFDELTAWSQGLESPAAAASAAVSDHPERLAAAVAADRERLRGWLRRLVGRPEIREALFVASPSLEEGLAVWLRDPEGKKGRRAEESLVRYVQRMAARATPFGLFSGFSTGVVGTGTRLRLAGLEEYGRRSRLDMDYLFTLAGDLQRVPELRRELRFRPNSSLYRAAGRLRYAESRREGTQLTHQLVAVDTHEYLEEALRQAERGATPGELAQALAAADPEGEISLEEAAEFVGELIDSQILTSDLSPPVTGLDPVQDLMDQLREHAAAAPMAGIAGVVERLEQARAGLARLDAAGLGSNPEAYRAIARDLEALPTRVDLSFLFQVDMIKPAPGLSLGPEVMAEIERGIGLLRRLSTPVGEDSLTRFHKDFVERYDRGREVPLAEALDEETGIGFERSSSIGTEGSPLLAGLIFPGQGGDSSFRRGVWHDRLLGKLLTAQAEGSREIEISDADLAGVDDRLPPMPDAFQVMATLAAADEAGRDFRLFLRNANGPSGARLLGRFCHLDPELHRHLEEHLRAEEALEPGTVFAEIVHLPQGRSGNVLWRPVLRGWEIPFLGRSGAPPERWLPMDDLLVSIQGSEIVLRSKRLGRRVIPRLTSAHSFGPRNLGTYRFLGSLQAQGVREGLYWSWGGLDGAAFLPRVSSGRLVLARARWRVPSAEIEALARASGADRFRVAQAWREQRGLPRWVVFVEYDYELLVDLDNSLSLDAFVGAARQRQQIDLVELFPGPDELAVSGPEGRFVNELVVPITRRREAVARRPWPAAVGPAVRRTFPPGSEWLYAKLYTGTSTADTVLRDLVAPCVRPALDSGAADSWFFIRYGDPRWHLRLRFQGDPRRLHGEVLPRLQEEAAALLEDGRLGSFQIDTYQREIERYGGPEGIELAERIFHADSEAVLEIVASLEGAEDADVRWRLALRGIDLFLSDLGFTGAGKLALLQQMQTSSAREARADGAFAQQLAQRLRRERAALAPYLEPGWDPERPDAPAFEALERRSQRLAPLAAELRERERAGRLTVSIADMVLSYTHMFANRLLRSEGAAHEVVLYDFLLRLHQSRAAREARKERE